MELARKGVDTAVVEQSRLLPPNLRASILHEIRTVQAAKERFRRHLRVGDDSVRLQLVEVAVQLLGERPAPDEHANLDVVVHGAAGEVGAGDERHRSVGDDGLRVHRCGAIPDDGPARDVPLEERDLADEFGESIRCS